MSKSVSIVCVRRYVRAWIQTYHQNDRCVTIPAHLWEGIQSSASVSNLSKFVIHQCNEKNWSDLLAVGWENEEPSNRKQERWRLPSTNWTEEQKLLDPMANGNELKALNTLTGWFSSNCSAFRPASSLGFDNKFRLLGHFLYQRTLRPALSEEEG